MQGASYRSDGVSQLKLDVQCGWEAPFAMNKWQATSKYVVFAAKTDTVETVIAAIKEQAGQNPNVDKLWAVAEGGKKIQLDKSKTLEENGLTVWGKFELRFPNSLG
eukprot:TRINITY_DN9113_c0_g1_i4.p1 TRINITY_DN9113_c0_g1~~TRINITY_DN9113_c0_g1_i4.p1  ORF type:complete len:106 (-),score=23.63 TRINITY_DN9113_c0_g1_i4:74-391(-)